MSKVIKWFFKKGVLMYRKRDGVPVFSKTTYYCRNPMRKIKYFFRDIKYSYQRIRYGWCDRDTWDIDYWFLSVIPPMLQHLRDNKHGYPSDMEEDEWDHILETMILMFTEANEDRCSKKNEYELKSRASEEERKIFLDKALEVLEYRNKCKNKGFEFFSKYFWNLWD